MLPRRKPHLSAPSPCPYLRGETVRFAYFFAHSVGEEELADLLSRGWRKFGYYYFRPACPECGKCIPIRLPVRALRPGRSRRKLIRRNGNTRVIIGPPRTPERAFEVYREHSATKFGKSATIDEFMASFYTPSCPALQSEYRIDGELAAVGFLDRAANALSSVYFVYRRHFKRYGLGIYSVFTESEYARGLGLDYYYLGY